MWLTFFYARHPKEANEFLRERGIPSTAIVSVILRPAANGNDEIYEIWYWE